MSERWTIERILRDDDDASGQTIRQWHLELEGRHVCIRKKDGSLPLLIRADDVAILVGDLTALIAARPQGAT